MKFLKDVWAKISDWEMLVAILVIGYVAYKWIYPQVDKAVDKVTTRSGGSAALAALLSLGLLLGAAQSRADVLNLPAASAATVAAPASGHWDSLPVTCTIGNSFLAAIPMEGPLPLIYAGFVLLAVFSVPRVRGVIRQALASKWGAGFSGGFAAVALAVLLAPALLQTSWARDSVLSFYNRLEIRAGNEANVATNGLLRLYSPSGSNSITWLTNGQLVFNFNGTLRTGYTGVVMATNSAGGVLSNYFWNGFHIGTNSTLPTSLIF